MAAADDSEAGYREMGSVIAATALEGGEAVLAGDSHFETIPGVTHESYR